MQSTENKLTPKQTKQRKTEQRVQRSLRNIESAIMKTGKGKTNIVLPILERQEAELAAVPHSLQVDEAGVLRFPGLVVKQLELARERAEEFPENGRTDPWNGHDLNETAEFIPAERKASWSLQACTITGKCERITPNFASS